MEASVRTVLLVNLVVVEVVLHFGRDIQLARLGLRDVVENLVDKAQFQVLGASHLVRRAVLRFLAGHQVLLVYFRECLICLRQ